MATALSTKIAATAKRLPSTGTAGVPFLGPALGPVSPPPGSYDPAIDAQVGQSNRGLQDLLANYIQNFGEPGTALGGRAGQDLGLANNAVQLGLDRGTTDVNTSADRGIADLQLGSGRSLADLQRNSGRTLADLLTARTRGGEDYQQNTADLGRSYQRLGDSQTQSAESAGVGRGGALAQALMKRTENQAHDQAPLDTAFSRFNADNSLQSGRVTEDTGIQSGRINEDLGIGTGRIGADRTTQLGRLTQDAGLATDANNLGFVRGQQDAGTQLAIAGRENTNFGLDANNQRLFQANTPLAGPPPAPFAPTALAAAVKKPKPVAARNAFGGFGAGFTA